MNLRVAPVTLAEANLIVSEWHRHHKPVRAHRFSIGAFTEYGGVVGVIIVGNPNALALAQHRTVFEILRSATHHNAGTLHAQGVLVGAARRAAFAMGCRRLISYTRADERGRSYVAAGFHRAAKVQGKEWNTGNKADRWLPGLYVPTTEIVARVRWESGPDCACSACSRTKPIVLDDVEPRSQATR